MDYQVGDEVVVTNPTIPSFNCQGQIVGMFNEGVIAGQAVAQLLVRITVGNELYQVGSTTSWYSESVAHASE